MAHRLGRSLNIVSSILRCSLGYMVHIPFEYEDQHKRIVCEELEEVGNFAR